MSGLLSVLAPEPTSEIVVRDHALRVVSAAPTFLEIEVPQGIYRVDVWVPGITDVDLVAVQDGQRVTHDRKGLVPDSVVPITGIRTASERHAELAKEVAAQPTHTLMETTGDAGRLLLFARSSGPPRFAAPRVSILDLSGKLLFTLDRHGRVDARYGCAGVSVDLLPGHYILRHSVPRHGTRAQVVRVAAHYETQIFAAWADDHIDLAAAVICMPPFGTGFDPTDRSRYLRAEHAVRALATGRMGPAPDYLDPLITMMDNAVRTLAGRDEVDATVEAAGLRWTDLELLHHPGASVQRLQPSEGPPVLDAAVAQLLELPDEDWVPMTWPTGMLTASTSGSVWARWDLDTAALAPTVPVSAVESAQPPIGTPYDAGIGSRPAGRVAQLRMEVLDAPGRTVLAAAEALTVSFDRGRHIDVALWAKDDPADVPPRAEIRVRIGAVARIYQRKGEPVRYGRAHLPFAAIDAVEMTTHEGENLLTHLAQYLRLGPED